MHVPDFPYADDNEHPRTQSSPEMRGEKGYSWLYLYITRSWSIALLVTLLVIAIGGAFYLWYDHPGNVTTPDGTAGLVYAFIGTGFFILAAILYSLRRRSHKRNTGQLHSALNWHVFLALTAVALLYMHAFGHFAPISGTFALYGLIALSVCGVIGRMLDRVMPRMIAREVNKALTAQGNDRVEVVSQKLQAIVVHNTQKLRSFQISPTQSIPASTTTQPSTASGLPVVSSKQSLHVPWDLAYISLEPTQQELDRDAPRYRFIPDKKSTLNQSGTLMPGTDEHVAELQAIHSAMQREQLYRYIIRYWRVFHICLAFITVGLVIWHIIFASTLLIPRFMH
ncbi:MAG TPA: hypothetical protein VNG51_25075 [Ktedonobacteraceae bacterium]|nr:hypothetical protein [Ktedonobacteraceae bacterium]